MGRPRAVTAPSDGWEVRLRSAALAAARWVALGRCPWRPTSGEARGPRLSLVRPGRCGSLQEWSPPVHASWVSEGGGHIGFGEAGGGGCGLILDKNPPAAFPMGVQGMWNVFVCWGGGGSNVREAAVMPPKRRLKLRLHHGSGQENRTGGGNGGCPWESVPVYQRQCWPGRPRAPGEGSTPKAVAGPLKRGWGSILQPPFLSLPHATRPNCSLSGDSS